MDEVAQGVSAGGPPSGMTELKLDDRGRIKLPSGWFHFFNGFAEKKLFVTSLDDVTARIYHITVWRENEKLLDAFDDDPDAAETVAFTANDNGSTVDFDAQGRFSVPQKLRELLRMDGQELHLYGYRSHIEVLTHEIYLERRKVTGPAKLDAARKLKRAGLK
jgi:transcriptional regulator MraZ